MNRRSLLPIALGAATLSGAVLLSLARDEDRVARSAIDDVARVRVAPVVDHVGERDLRFPGTTRAADRASIAFMVGGRIARRPIEVGDRVRRGDLLAELDVRELDNALHAAEATLAELEARAAQSVRDLRRVERLAEQKAATDEEREQVASRVDAVEASRRAAEARVAEARRLRGEGVIVAPYAGTVVGVRAEPGETVPAGHTIVELAGDGDVEVEVGVPESWIGRLSEGDAVAVVLPFHGASREPARVTSIGRAAGTGRLFPVVVTLDAGDRAAPGMAAEVVLSFRGRGERSVPLAAVINPGGSRPAVYRLADDRVLRTPVEIVALAGDRVVVEGPLESGADVVVEGHLSLVDGDRVEVIR